MKVGFRVMGMLWPFFEPHTRYRDEKSNFGPVASKLLCCCESNFYNHSNEPGHSNLYSGREIILLLLVILQNQPLLALSYPMAP